MVYICFCQTLTGLALHLDAISGWNSDGVKEPFLASSMTAKNQSHLSLIETKEHQQRNIREEVSQEEDLFNTVILSCETSR